MRIPTTTSQATPFLSEVLEAEVIPEPYLAYFRARLSNRLHELVLSTFLKVEKHLSRADLAKRVGRKPEQITRWFASPGNWTLDTVSDLLIGMGYEPELSVTELKQRAPNQERKSTQLPDATLSTYSAHGAAAQAPGPLGSAQATIRQPVISAQPQRAFG